jgi:hypothetical protein
MKWLKSTHQRLFITLIACVASSSSFADIRLTTLGEVNNQRAFATLPSQTNNIGSLQAEVDEQNAFGRLNVWASASSSSDQTSFMPRNLYANLLNTQNNKLMIGTQVRTWGYGYGFHPLSPGPEPTTFGLKPTAGQPMLMLEHYGETDTVTALCGRNVDWQQRQWQGDAYCAGNWSHAGDGLDWQVAVIQLGQSYRTGVALQQTVGDAWAFWQEIAYQNQGNRFETVNNQLTLSQHNDNILALLGGQWSHEMGITLLAEVWHNELAPSQQTWQNTLNNAAINPSIGNLMQTPYLGQDYALLRVSFSKDDWESSIMTMRSLADYGWLQQLEIKHNWDEVSGMAGIRAFNGDTQSHWQQQPLASVAYLGVEWRY